MKKSRKLIVIFDTNCLISAALIADSVNEQALNRVLLTGMLAFSKETFSELVEVLYRPKFDKYLSEERRLQLIERIERNAQFYSPTQTIRACRDPKDDMFLELAVTANAHCIVTGDKALLDLHPFQNIPILSPAQFVARNFES